MNRRLVRLVCCLAFGVAILAGDFILRPSAADEPQPVAAPQPVISSLTPAGAERVLSTFGLEFKEVEKGMYVFRHEDLKLLFHNGHETLHLYSNFPSAKAELTKINDWNRTKRFAKAFLNEHNQPTLTADLELTGGVTEQNLMEWLKTYVAYLKQFKEFIEK
ncbi:MAG: YbjN domain-containing protein [Planctomycetes bacterium]|nr:YbjN domain-containing protein [Planctomycetota bacterium]